MAALIFVTLLPSFPFQGGTNRCHGRLDSVHTSPRIARTLPLDCSCCCQCHWKICRKNNIHWSDCRQWHLLADNKHFPRYTCCHPRCKLLHCMPTHHDSCCHQCVNRKNNHTSMFRSREEPLRIPTQLLLLISTESICRCSCLAQS